MSEGLLRREGQGCLKNHEKKRMSKHINKIIFGIASVLFAYTAYRAAVLSITWDEAFSYLHFVRHEILFPEKYETMDANNHLLNTWLNIRFVKWFGVSELVLRLPALIAHLLFLFFSYKLVKNFENKWLVLASFLIVNLNPYILDFFSLSRGYALSLGLMVASVYYIYCFINNDYKTKHLFVAIFLGGLATAANFVLLNYFVVSFGLLFLLLLYNFKLEKNTKKFIFSFTSSTIIFSLFLLFFIPIALKLKDAGALFYGGNTGFWTDTFGTITDRSFYELGYNYWFHRLAKGFVILIMLGATCLLIMRFARKQISKNVIMLSTLALLLGLSALSTMVQHQVLDTLYLIDRTAMFLVVLFNLLLVFFIAELSIEKKQTALVSYFAGAFAVFHFVLSFNLHYVLEWKSNADVKQMLSDLKKVVEIPKEKMNVSICIPLSFDQSINYYRAVDNLTWINTVERSSKVNYLFDYLYLEPKEFALANPDSMIVFNTYNTTNNIFGKPKYAPNFTNVHIFQELDFKKTKEGIYEIDAKTEYSQGFNYIINDSITPERTAEIVFKATVMAKDLDSCDLGIIISLENKKGVYVWKRAYVQDYIKKENEWVDISYTYLIPKETVEGDELKCYIWNPNKHKISVKKMEFKWLSKP